MNFSKQISGNLMPNLIMQDFELCVGVDVTSIHRMTSLQKKENWVGDTSLLNIE